MNRLVKHKNNIPLVFMNCLLVFKVDPTVNLKKIYLTMFFLVHEHSNCSIAVSSVARDGGLQPPPPFCLTNEIHNNENTTFFTLLRQSFAVIWTLR